MLFKYDRRPVVIILYSIQTCLNHSLDLSDSSPSLLYIFVCDAPRIGLVMASAALY